MSERDDERAGGFLSRWARRKAEVGAGRPVPAEAVVPPAAPPVAATAPVAARPAGPASPAPAVESAAEPAPPPPTLEEAQALTPQSDFRRFVARDVDPSVKNTALKQLFADPHFNVMDGLDIYIDDYGKPDPLPPNMLRQLAQSQMLGLFRDEAEPSPASAGAAAPHLPESPETSEPPTAQDHEDADLRLQPDDAAGPADAGPDERGPGEDAGRER